jgi:hypothetical protein
MSRSQQLLWREVKRHVWSSVKVYVQVGTVVCVLVVVFGSLVGEAGIVASVVGPSLGSQIHESFIAATPSALKDQWLGNPLADLDASAATDADDLAVFVGDVFEFSEHEQALLADSSFELAGALGAGIGVGGFLSIRALKRS